jgi:hypothetical protein
MNKAGRDKSDLENQAGIGRGKVSMRVKIMEG